MRYNRRKKKNEAIPNLNKILLSGSAVPTPTYSENTLAVAKEIIKEQLKRPDIEIIRAERYGKSSQRGAQNVAKSKILIEVATPDIKSDIIHTAIDSRPTDLFLNEVLTPNVNNIYCTINYIVL